MSAGLSSRLLTPVLVGGDDAVLALLPQLRAALNGSGPALLPRGADTFATASATELSISRGPAGEPVEDDPQDPTAVAVQTSGSGGAAKTVLLSAAALLASAAATHDRVGGAGHWLLALPVQHIAGVQVLVRSLIAGTTPAVLDLNSHFTPEAFTAAAGRVGGRPGTRRYTALVPTQLTRLLNAPGPAGEAALAALRSFDAILIGGAATAPTLLERAAAAGVRLVTTYGMSETGGGCVYDGVRLDGVRVDLRLDSARSPVDVEGDSGDGEGDSGEGEGGDGDWAGPGRAGPGGGSRVRLTGRVLLGGPTVARGYLRDAAATQAAFTSGPDGVRWFRTDDAGTLETDGELRILGRLDSIIITGGVNVAPAPVEAALHRLPGVAQAVVVGLPDEEWGQRVAAALVLHPGARPPTLAAARDLVSAEVCGPAAPRQLTVLADLPQRGPGKPDRRAIAQVLLEQPPLEGI